MSLITSFMEGYNSNLNIGAVGLDEFFADTQPVSLDEMMESIYETQYGCEAVLVMTEQAINLQEAGVAAVNEGLIGDAAVAIKDKIVELAQKLKGFIVTACKKIVDFFKDIYAKSAPLDKIMQATNKTVVTDQDIKQAIANGWKLPGRYWLIGDTDLENIDLSSFKGLNMDVRGGKVPNGNELIALLNSMVGTGKKDVEAAKDKLKDIKEATKTFFEDLPWESDAKMEALYGEGKDGNDKSGIIYRKGPQKDDQSKKLDKEAWKKIKEYALEGQKKQRTYIRNLQKESQKAIRAMENAARELSKENKDWSKKDKEVSLGAVGTTAAAATDTIPGRSAKEKGRYNTTLSYAVQACTTLSSFYMKVASKVVLPIMKKQHRAAISTFIYVQGSVKRVNKKADKI